MSAREKRAAKVRQTLSKNLTSQLEKGPGLPVHVPERTLLLLDIDPEVCGDCYYRLTKPVGSKGPRTRERMFTIRCDRLFELGNIPEYEKEKEEIVEADLSEFAAPKPAKPVKAPVKE